MADARTEKTGESKLLTDDMRTVSFKVDKAIYDKVYTYCVANDLSIASLARKEFLKVVKKIEREACSSATA